MAAACAVPGLEALLNDKGLEAYISAASQWCDDQGARFLEELSEDEVFNMLVEDLKMKPLEKKRLKKGLEETLESAKVQASGGYSGAVAPVPAASSASSSTAAALAAVMEKPKQSVFVKNTFLDLDDNTTERQTVLRRASTCPVEAEVIEVEVDDEDESEDDEPSSGAADVIATPSPMAGLYKTVTCDGYEPDDQWAWLSGDPNANADASSATPMRAVAENLVASPDPGDVGISGYDASSWAPGMYDEPQMMSVVMVPTSEVSMYPVSAGPSWMQPGCVVVPMNDRFVRWPGEAEAEEETAAAEKEHARKNVLQRAFSVTSAIYRVRWTVDARKLKSKDTEAVSPSFELSFEGNVAFKMLLRPRVTSESKGGASFKKARGRGVVELRCLDDVHPEKTPTVTFRVFIGSPADPAKQQPPRGPVRHDFAQKSICGLSRGQDEWNFSQVVDKTSQTFVVVLEVLTGPASSAA